MPIITETANPGDPSTWHPSVRDAWIKAGLLNPDGSPIGGGGGGGGSSSSTTNSNTNYNKTITPFVTPEYAALMNLVRSAIENRVRFPAQFGREMLAQGIQSTNNTYQGAEQGLMNRLNAMGALGSPAAGVPMAVLQASRASDIAGFRNQIPTMQRQMQTQDLGLAQSLAQMFGLGQNEKGRSSTTSTTTGRSSGGGGGGNPGLGLAQMVSQNWQQQQQQQHAGGGIPWGDILKTLPALLALL